MRTTAAVLSAVAMLCGSPSLAQDAKSNTVTNSIGMELVQIPAGKFRMGEGGRDVVDVTLTRPFLLGKTEVTQGQFKNVMGSEPWAGRQFVQAGDDYPATFVTWDDAIEFCKRLTELEHKSGKLPANEKYRLPTEAEWEYACRAGTTTQYSFGDDFSKLGEYAWWGGQTGDGNAKSEPYAHRVATKKPNPWGLYDMHGNVHEWCFDSVATKLPGGVDPVVPEEEDEPYRMIRGGSWRDFRFTFESYQRHFHDMSVRYNNTGFRVARSQ